MVAVREKKVALGLVHTSLYVDLHLKEYQTPMQDFISSTPEETQPSIESLMFSQLNQLIRMMTQRRFEDAIRLADQLHDRYIRDKNVPLDYTSKVVNNATNILQLSALIKPPISDEIRKSILQRQYHYMTSDLEKIKHIKHKSFLDRAKQLALTFDGCIKFWPERRQEYLQIVRWYFEAAQDTCREIRRTLLSDLGVDQWIRRRTLSSMDTFRSICKVAADDYLRTECYSTAWNWIQRGQAQALQEMLTDRDTAKKTYSDDFAQ